VIFVISVIFVPLPSARLSQASTEIDLQACADADSYGVYRKRRLGGYR